MPRLTLDVALVVRVAYDGRELFTYIHLPDDAASQAPRPYLHPVRALSGELVSLARPHDATWHRGLSFAVPRVGSHDLWGGPGPAADRGSMDHQYFTEIRERTDHVAFGHELLWHGRSRTGLDAGPELVRERRTLRVSVAAQDAWVLAWESVLTNVSGEDLPLAPSGARGEPGVGGLVWCGPRSFTGGTLLLPDGAAARQAHGHAASWVGFTGRHDGTGAASTVVLVDDEANPGHPARWFAGAEPFAALGPTPFRDGPVEFPPDATHTFRYAVVVGDGLADVASAADLAALGREAIVAAAAPPPPPTLGTFLSRREARRLAEAAAAEVAVAEVAVAESAGAESAGGEGVHAEEPAVPEPTAQEPAAAAVVPVIAQVPLAVPATAVPPAVTSAEPEPEPEPEPESEPDVLATADLVLPDVPPEDEPDEDLPSPFAEAEAGESPPPTDDAITAEHPRVDPAMAWPDGDAERASADDLVPPAPAPVPPPPPAPAPTRQSAWARASATPPPPPDAAATSGAAAPPADTPFVPVFVPAAPPPVPLPSEGTDVVPADDAAQGNEPGAPAEDVEPTDAPDLAEPADEEFPDWTVLRDPGPSQPAAGELGGQDPAPETSTWAWTPPPPPPVPAADAPAGAVTQDDVARLFAGPTDVAGETVPVARPAWAPVLAEAQEGGVEENAVEAVPTGEADLVEGSDVLAEPPAEPLAEPPAEPLWTPPPLLPVPPEPSNPWAPPPPADEAPGEPGEWAPKEWASGEPGEPPTDLSLFGPPEEPEPPDGGRRRPWWSRG